MRQSRRGHDASVLGVVAMVREALVTIVLVNYARAQDTIACLETLALLEGCDFEVVLVDNGSPDTSAADLARWLGCAPDRPSDWLTVALDRGHAYRLRFVPHPENTGFAGGCNIGMRLALDNLRCTHIWLLNNDTLVEEGSLSALLARCSDGSGIAMCGSTLVYHSPPGTLQGCGGRFDLNAGRGRPIAALAPVGELPDQAQVEREMDYVIGASMLVTVDLVRKVGLMDERYFLYFEELDWALRARAQGFRLGWAPASVVIHKEGAAIGTSMRARPSAMATYFMTAGYLRVVWFNRKALLPVALLLSLMRAARLCLQREWRLAAVTLQAVGSFLHHPDRYRPGAFRGVGSRRA